MKTVRRWRDALVSSDPPTRVRMTMAWLAFVLMLASVGVMALLAWHGVVNAQHTRWWAALSLGGLGAALLAIRSGWSRRWRDPALTVPQMAWGILSGAAAYVMAGEARGLVPAVLAMILFFGTFTLSLRQVLGMGVFALLSFGVALACTSSRGHFGVLDLAYGAMLVIVLLGGTAMSVRAHQIRQRLRRQHEALVEALAVNRTLAMVDELTGLLNRRQMLVLMEREAQRIERSGQPLVLAQLDLDHFKAVNDTYGHAVGDAALRSFAQTLQGMVRGSDLLARWGGEEFVLMCCDTGPGEAAQLLERLRSAVQAMRLNDGQGREVRLTVSIGAAEHHAGEGIACTLDQADRALYDAKRQGRNRVVFAQRAAR